MFCFVCTSILLRKAKCARTADILLYDIPCVIDVRLFLGRQLLFSPVGFFSLVFFLPFPFLAGRPHLGKARKMGTSSSSFLSLAKCHSHSHLQNTISLFLVYFCGKGGRPFLISDMDGDGGRGGCVPPGERVREGKHMVTRGAVLCASLCVCKILQQAA